MASKHLIKISAIFFISITVFLLYSFSDIKISVFGFDLKKYYSEEEFVKDLVSPGNNSLETISAGNNNIQDKLRQKVFLDSSAQRILLIGDSMCEGLMYPLNDYCMENNHELFPVVYYNSSTKSFGTTNTISSYIKKYKPTFIIVALGSNELFVKDISSRKKYIEDIKRQIDTINMVWVGPPNWKKDTGINDLIKSVIGEDNYFESKNLKFDRISDGAHPTRNSSKMWADKISEWIKSASKHPIMLNKPEKHYIDKINPVLHTID
jgi:hypothetical protein